MGTIHRINNGDSLVFRGPGGTFTVTAAEALARCLPKDDTGEGEESVDLGESADERVHPSPSEDEDDGDYDEDDDD